MEIVPTDYPEFFPCPTWQYGQGQASFTQRVPFDSGWVRQRRKFDDTYLSIDLSFIMSTAVYSRWSDWVNANGYDWFVIPLDRFEGEKKDFTIRFKSILNMAYDAYDRVIVTVSAEQYEGKPNPDKIYNPGGANDGCYSCSALDDALTQEGFISIIDLSPPEGTWDWPLAPVRSESWGHPELISAWNNYIPGANLQDDWGGSVVQASMAGWTWYDSAVKWKQCGNGEELSALAMNISGNASGFALSVPYVAGQASTGSASFNAVFTGWNGGTDASISIYQRPAGMYYKYNTVGTYVGESESRAFVNLATVTPGGEHKITLSAGDGEGLQTGEFSIGDIGGQWNNITITERTWVETIDRPGSPGEFSSNIWSEVTALVTGQDGEAKGSGSVSGYVFEQQATTAILQNPVASPALYRTPAFFRASSTSERITLASMAYSDSSDADKEYISRQFLRNFTDYC